MKLYLSLAAYVAAIVTANYMTSNYGLVPVGLGLLVTAGTFAAGFALLARDFVQRYGNVRWALGAIAVGAALSWLFASPGLVLASTVAFAAAEMVDLLIYTPMRKRGFIPAALLSNVVSAPIDTVLFLWLAGFPLTLAAVEGQFIGKVLWATIVPLALFAAAKRLGGGEGVSSTSPTHAGLRP
ncbi:MAG: VUT family protein [Thermoleophilia bacterium]|nr:VUT family protein [Thermoleophilia bacterium]